MKEKRTFAWFGIVFLAAVLAGVFVHVLELRLTKGDVYPHYASWRTDPLGASGLYESIGRLPGVTVSRNLEPLTRIGSLEGDAALFVLGVPRTEFDRLRIPDDSPVLQAIEERGTRLVITIDPQIVPLERQTTFSEDEEDWIERRNRLREERKEDDGPGGEEDEAGNEEDAAKPSSDEEEIEQEKTRSLGPTLGSRFGLAMARIDTYERPEAGWDAKPGPGKGSRLPRGIPVWKSPYRFEIDRKQRDDWRVVAAVEGEPVVVEREIGEGSLVLSTDSYFASNEALFGGGDSEFLLWLMGDKRRIVFDETLHGSQETGSMMKTLRSFRLHGFLIGAIVFILLWAWRSGTSLTPGDESIERGLIAGGGTVSGENSNAGLIQLLRRSIPGSELIDNCVRTWEQTGGADLPEEKRRKLNELLERHRREPESLKPVEAYGEISALLKKR